MCIDNFTIHALIHGVVFYICIQLIYTNCSTFTYIYIYSTFNNALHI